MIHNPKHPGYLIKSLCLEPLGMSVTQAAKVLKVSRPSLSKVLNGHISISPEMAVRLSIVFNTSDKLWVDMQAGYDLWKAQQKKSKLHLKPFVTTQKNMCILSS
ncbi:MAG: transcriptional regulator, family [Gammaproteobacteria bacterium]|jgi:addiction module HigA family antidote|nr:transcriptional regulator, family [Gammaproteobacteria bacterium]MCE3238428.1 transcriptional regulator, family [Gammaproteobacteria bacterium]